LRFNHKGLKVILVQLLLFLSLFLVPFRLFLLFLCLLYLLW
jgi:hypothetical protein